jgi:hypothetical protein
MLSQIAAMIAAAVKKADKSNESGRLTIVFFAHEW